MAALSLPDRLIYNTHVDDAAVEPVLSGPLNDGFQRGVVAVDDDVDRPGLGPVRCGSTEGSNESSASHTRPS
jgi:hypothetical protein